MHLFISHSSENDAFVTGLAAKLREAGHMAWVDHEDIKPGEDWDASVSAALEATDAMILVMTPRAMRSQNVKVEWSYFLDFNKPIYPVLIELCKTPFRLRLLQHSDFTKNEAQATKRLLETLDGKRSFQRKTERARKKSSSGEWVPITANNARDVDTIASLSGHRDSVKNVAFSIDGALVASVSDDKNVRLWNTVRQTQAKTLIGHEGPVNDLAFSPDGTILATASADRTIRLWDVARRYGLTAFTGHLGSVNGVGFSSDGSLIASAGDDGTVRLWDASKRTALTVLQGHSGPINDVVFRPHSTLLVSVSLDNTARLWDASARCEIGVIETKQEARCAAFSPDGKILAIGLSGGGILVFDPDSRAKIGAIWYADYNANCVRGLAFSPDGSVLAMASLDGNLRLWKTATLDQEKRALRVLRGHEAPCCGLAFSPDGRLIASVSHDATIRLWAVGE